MKKLLVLTTLFLLLVGNVSSAMSAKSTGPASNSGDGVFDGSGLDTQNGPNGDAGDPPGPAPNSGDGVSDGSGLNTQNGPNGNAGDPSGPAPNSGDSISDGSGF